jgi:hypothetical protein
MSVLPPTSPQRLTYVGLCFHIVLYKVKGVGDREILETYLNSASKNTPETDTFPHGTKSLLTNVIIVTACGPCQGTIICDDSCV